MCIVVVAYACIEAQAGINTFMWTLCCCVCCCVTLYLDVASKRSGLYSNACGCDIFAALGPPCHAPAGITVFQTHIIQYVTQWNAVSFDKQ